MMKRPIAVAFAAAVVLAAAAPARAQDWGEETGKHRLEAVTTVLVRAGQTADAGTIFLSGPPVDIVYAHPSWRGPAEIQGRLHSTTSLYSATHPERRFADRIEAPAMGDATESFALSPDGKLFATRTGEKAAFVDAAKRELVKVVEFAPLLGLPELSFGGIALPAAFAADSDSRGAWLPDGTGVGHGGYIAMPTIVPALQLACVDGRAGLLKTYPEWAVKGPPYTTIGDIAVDREGKVAYFVLKTPVDLTTFRADLYSWDSTTDTTTRLTSLGDVFGVSQPAAAGR